MPPISSADIADLGFFLRLGALAPSNAVYTMQYMKMYPIVQHNSSVVSIDARNPSITAGTPAPRRRSASSLGISLGPAVTSDMA